MTATPKEVRARLGHLNIRWLERNGWAVVPVEPPGDMAERLFVTPTATMQRAIYRAVVSNVRVTAEE